MKPVINSILELKDNEPWALACILKLYFPWLGTDNEADGSETISELAELYSALPQIEETTL